jgi:hypothetical protein
MPEEVIASALAFLQRRGQPQATARAAPAPGYNPDSLNILFGRDGS